MQTGDLRLDVISGQIKEATLLLRFFAAEIDRSSMAAGCLLPLSERLERSPGARLLDLVGTASFVPMGIARIHGGTGCSV